MFPKHKRQADVKYLNWLKRLPCLLCGGESEPHHIPEVGHGGKGIKTDDKRAIPLCHKHHMEFHNNGRSSFASMYSINYEHTILELNRIYKERLDAVHK